MAVRHVGKRIDVVCIIMHSGSFCVTEGDFYFYGAHVREERTMAELVEYILLHDIWFFDFGILVVVR